MSKTHKIEPIEMNQLADLRTQLSRKNTQPAMAYEAIFKKAWSGLFKESKRFLKERTDINLRDYIKSKPTTRTATRKYFYIQKLGQFTNQEQAAINELVEYIGLFYGVEIRFLEDLDSSLIANNAINKMSDGKQGIDADNVMYNLVVNVVPRSAIAHIVITSFFLSNFSNQTNIMGCATLEHRAAIWSLAPFHFDKKNIGSNFFQNTLEHLFKLSIHELGHVFGLPHCEKYECIMGIVSNDYLDDYPMSYCPNCFSKLFWNLQLDEFRWLEKQYKYWTKIEHTKNTNYYNELFECLSIALQQAH